MTSKVDKLEMITSLKNRQQEKKFQIEQYKKKTKRRLFVFSLVIVLFTLFFLEDSYKYFGNIETFVIWALSILLLFLIVYNLVVFLLIKRRRKEIKKINRRIHKLMKLSKK